MIERNKLEELRAALAEALAELQQAEWSEARGVSRQWCMLVGVKVRHAAALANGVEPAAVEPAAVEPAVG